MTTLTGSVALITGASRGLGLEIARLYATRGARLVITARGAEALAAAEAELARHADVLALPADVADPAQASSLVAAAIERFGAVDVLVNNASALGPSPMPPLERYPLDALADVLRTNALAPLCLAQLVLPAMRQRGAGVIVNVTSDAGVNAYPGWGGYGASKAALEHLSRTLAAELEGSGIRVYVVDPGDMNTRMHQDAEPGVDLAYLPGPQVAAPAFVRLVEEEQRPFARVEAQALALAAL
jgi:NAD(P)-dependent dehydrogenase (short-subunit alcohol dehydrogenase family)